MCIRDRPWNRRPLDNRRRTSICRALNEVSVPWVIRNAPPLVCGLTRKKLETLQVCDKVFPETQPVEAGRVVNGIKPALISRFMLLKLNAIVLAAAPACPWSKRVTIVEFVDEFSPTVMSGTLTCPGNP